MISEKLTRIRPGSWHGIDRGRRPVLTSYDVKFENGVTSVTLREERGKLIKAQELEIMPTNQQT